MTFSRLSKPIYSFVYLVVAVELERKHALLLVISVDRIIYKTPETYNSGLEAKEKEK